jgi:hypothetical protein
MGGLQRDDQLEYQQRRQELEDLMAARKQQALEEYQRQQIELQKQRAENEELRRRQMIAAEKRRAAADEAALKKKTDFEATKESFYNMYIEAGDSPQNAKTKTMAQMEAKYGKRLDEGPTAGENIATTQYARATGAVPAYMMDVSASLGGTPPTPNRPEGIPPATTNRFQVPYIGEGYRESAVPGLVVPTERQADTPGNEIELYLAAARGDPDAKAAVKLLEKRKGATARQPSASLQNAAYKKKVSEAADIVVARMPADRRSYAYVADLFRNGELTESELEAMGALAGGVIYGDLVQRILDISQDLAKKGRSGPDEPAWHRQPGFGSSAVPFAGSSSNDPNDPLDLRGR